MLSQINFLSLHRINQEHLKVKVSTDVSYRIVLIGAGRVATHLGLALARAGQQMVAVYSRTQPSAQRLADRLGCTALTSLSLLPKDADLYVVSVADSAVASILEGMPRVEGVVVHTAGSLPLSLLASEKWKGYGVFYPLQTFSMEREVDFSRLTCYVEADGPETFVLLRQLAQRLGSACRTSTSEQRRWLHVAAVFACNFSNHCYAMADHIMQCHGMAFGDLLPLIEETVGKLRDLTPLEAQTGPAVRNDREVMACHEQMLANEEGLLSAYRLMSQSIAAMHGQNIHTAQR
ncbi:MAG: DUF2520 domain-containing protein [Bacteroidaceae bacterium]|nr:DUF2520 domain-containing protein [Bacteroidaceae bacterium]